MASVEVANGHPPEPPAPAGTQAQLNETALESKPTKRPPNKRKPDYASIHSKPLPLNVQPLPAFHPTNPISLLRFAYAYLSQILAAPTSHPAQLYIGYFSPETRSVHVTDSVHARALWEMGFFGKGTLSRSEPSWLDREKARLLAKRVGSGGTAEEATNARREKRRLFKLDRARAEAEKIERQRLVEEGKLDPSVLETEVVEIQEGEEELVIEATPRPLETTIPNPAVTELRPQLADLNLDEDDQQEEEPIPHFTSQEHLQLTLEEAFFLSYSLGVLSIRIPSPNKDTPPTSNTTPHLLKTFSSHSSFPPQITPLKPDSQFLLNYIVYHHFRSLGWTVRSGLKFSIDYLLYYRGPALSHAEFAVTIIPAYTDPYWSTPSGLSERRVQEDEGGDWWWMHCVNRVQSQVLKTMVLVYVDVPAPLEGGDGEGEDVGGWLRRYKVREFVVKRWTPNRSRD